MPDYPRRKLLRRKVLFAPIPDITQEIERRSDVSMCVVCKLYRLNDYMVTEELCKVCCSNAFHKLDVKELKRKEKLEHRPKVKREKKPKPKPSKQTIAQRREYMRQWRLANRDRANAHHKKYRQHKKAMTRRKLQNQIANERIKRLNNDD